MSLLDPQGTRMLLARVPLPRSRLHSVDVPQMVAGRGDAHAVMILGVKADTGAKR